MTAAAEGDRTSARLRAELGKAMAADDTTAEAASIALGRGDLQTRLGAALLAFAGHRAPAGSTCPSEAARVVGGDDWRGLMTVTRDVAVELARSGHVVVTQRGVVLDANTPWRGPVRIRLPRS